MTTTTDATRSARAATLRCGLAAGALALAAVAGLPTDAAAATYSAPLQTAIADLPVAAEQRDGYDRDLFEHWVDADGDGCDARDEVLIAEADDAPTVGAGCDLSGGRWYSYYDGVSQYDTSDIDIDHMVPLAEAWDSGAYAWDAGRREAYANDLDDYRTLVGVTDSVNQSKSDQDVAEWLPDQQQCRYLREYVAVKIRWDLSVDTAEQAAMNDLAADCDNLTIEVETV
ncbi:HNH endonuclease family protein [Georgenia deserti]|uniref:HNH endonuclease family protein n=1 Tax=Georgenia deserti TaxID=2093781 RepID=A0ABW4L3H4_9MICO